jgi:hypothetical protein
MNTIPCLGTINDLQQLTDTWRPTISATLEYLALIGAVALVTLLIAIWAIYFRKPHHRHSHSHSHVHQHAHEWGKNPGAPTDAAFANQPSQRRKWRRRRREHRPRNPTLAETGGLPPIRDQRPGDPI